VSDTGSPEPLVINFSPEEKYLSIKALTSHKILLDINKYKMLGE
jgi:hypothetical protein